ncbi:MAG: DUF192 domain-containing protein [Candidatus Daviesbacteria bacterium]|nr:DUF192 domain-containing protein [Candidatus Daviesbacteria bacterium]
MRKFIIQALFLLLIAAAALFLFSSPTEVNLPFLPERTIIKQIEINDARIKAEVVNSQAKRKQGLSGRAALASDEGMLFVFEESGKHPFWMKGLNFALDFIWINGDKIVDITENIQPPVQGQKDESLPIYESKEDANKILEVSAQTAQRLNIKVGDTVKIE